MLDDKRLKFYEQEGAGMCGPAALRIVLAYFGMEKTEAELVEMCRATSEEGAAPTVLEAVLQNLGFSVQTGVARSKEESWQALNHWVNEVGVPVIVNWFSPPADKETRQNAIGRGLLPPSAEWGGHYSVVYRVTPDEIGLADPAFNEESQRQRRLSWDYFCSLWFDFPGDHIQSRDQVLVRWWLAARPKS